MIRHWLVTPFVAFTFGCTVGPDYSPPEMELPATWRDEIDGLVADRGPDPVAWWRRFEDPVLDALVLRALGDGLELREAYGRLRESRALRGAAVTELLPRLDGDADVTRIGDSASTPFGAFATDYTRYGASLDASWELDLWGRVRRSIEAADADLAAVTEDVRAVAVTVAAEVAWNYVALRTAQHRLGIARANVELQRQTLGLVEGRLAAGLVGERDLAQARTNLATTRARLPALELELRVAENRLAVLVGAAPGALAAELAEPRPVPAPPTDVGVGVPADLLRRRPDVRRAERELAAETARVGVALAEFYPQLALGGTIGVVADRAERIGQGMSGAFALGPTLRWNLFDGGRSRRLARAQQARVEQALARWRLTVLEALEEAEVAMTAFGRERQRRDELSAAVTAAGASVELAKAQYEQGLTDFQAVLDSERELAELDDRLATSGAAVTRHLVGLYKALGGGWSLPTPSPIDTAVAGRP